MTEADPPSDGALQRTAQICRAVGDVERLRILLALLEQQEQCVSDLASGLDEPIASVSQRLRILRETGLVARRREGKQVFYRLTDEAARLLRCASEVWRDDAP